MGNKRSYGGRTAIPEKHRRNVFLKVRVTKKEKESVIKLHEMSLFDNFSELVRGVLFQNKIAVKIVNVEILALENRLEQIEYKCETFLRKKRESDEALKPIIREMIEELAAIKLKIKSPTLLLQDLEAFSEAEKQESRKWWSNY
jgi:hypothetical protein